MNSPIFQRIMKESQIKGSSLASTQHLRNNMPQPSTLGDYSEPSNDLPSQMYTQAVDPLPRASDRYQGGTSKHTEFMDKLFDVETKGGTIPDRKGSQYKGIAQLGNAIRKPLLKKMGYTEEQYNSSRDIQAEVAGKHIDNLRSRLKKNGFEATDTNLWLSHNLGFGGMSQVRKGKVSAQTLKNIRNQAHMNKTSTPEDYLKYYGSIFN